MDMGRLLKPAPAEAVAGGFARRFRHLLLRTWSGRVVLGAAVLYGLALTGLPVPDPIRALAGLVLFGFAVYAAVRIARWMLRRLLWRIRTKLILSYLFIAVVPVVLLTAFFMVAALLGTVLVSSYMVGAHLQAEADELRTLARATLAGSPASEAGLDRFRAQLAQVKAMHPHVRHALVRGGRPVSADGIVAGAPPEWLKEQGFAGGVRLARDEDVLRGLWREGDSMLMFDVPLQRDLFAHVERRTGVRVVSRARDHAPDNPSEGADAPAMADPSTRAAASARPAPDPEPTAAITAVALVPVREWQTGEVDLEPIGIRVQPRQLLERLSPPPVGRAAPEVLMTALAALGGIFLVLYSGALVVGLVLARSITRSVHALSRGTERLRRGDFGEPIPVQSRDQLGELADSFNAAARGGASDRASDPDEPAAAGHREPAGAPHRRALPACGRGGRRLLRPPSTLGYADGRARGRRVRQGHFRRPVHGRAEGADAVAVAYLRFPGAAPL
jgi:sigma-B regulation protein RsbU (phosphoserine phosphatase)